MAAKSTLFYTSSDGVTLLTGYYGDRLEKLTANDKLGLIAILAMWLAHDEEDYNLGAASIDVAHLMSLEDDVYHAVALLEDLDPKDAQSLMSALIEQVRFGVFAA